MDVRRRIAAIALFGVQLLQGVFPAAGAACERPTDPVSAPATVMITAHHHHGASTDHAPANFAPPAAGVMTDAPMSAPVQRLHGPAACPMAMACTVVGVMSSAVAVATVDVVIDVHRPVHVAEWPVSLDVAPEPRPPRA